MKMRLAEWRLIPSSGRGVDALDGLRGIAILMVVTFHAVYFNPTAPFSIRILGEYVGAGWMGVPIFFILSGFLIAQGFFQQRLRGARNCVPARYFRRRFFKIVPPFFFSLAAFTTVLYFTTRNAEFWRAAGIYALGLNGFMSSPFEINRAYWSLILEVQFYLLLPLLFTVTRKFNVHQAAIIVISSLLILPSITRWLMLDNLLDVEVFKFRSGLFLNQMDYFGWGVAFAYLYSLRKSMFLFLADCYWLCYWGAGLLIGVTAWWAWLNHSFDYVQHPALWLQSVLHLWLGLAGFLLLFSVFLSKGLLFNLLKSPALMFIGIVSYEWFLFHDPVLRGAEALIGRSHGNLWMVAARIVAPLAITFIFSAVFYRYFSLPILRLGRIPPASSIPSAPSAGLSAAIKLPPS